MSAADQSAAMAAALKEALQELEVSMSALNATRYLSAAGLVILLYDHLLLFGEETRLIWSAKWSWPKALFIFNRYTVPVCILITTYELSGLSGGAGLSTRVTWISTASILGVITLAIANVFVVQRVYALWGRSQRVLRILVAAFVAVYVATLVSVVIATIRMIPHISYSPLAQTCNIDKKPILFVETFAIPICFDVFLFVLMCWNAFDRPRHMQTAIVKQLYQDGVVYFASLLTLRLFNIIVIGTANKSFVQLGAYFIWSMITTLINRMLITISSTATSAAARSRARDPTTGRETPSYGQMIEAPFELSAVWTVYEENFIDLEPDWKGEEERPGTLEAFPGVGRAPPRGVY